MILEPQWENTNGHKIENMLILTEERKKKKGKSRANCLTYFMSIKCRWKSFHRGGPAIVTYLL